MKEYNQVISRQSERHSRRSRKAGRQPYYRKHYRKLYAVILMTVIIVCGSVIIFGKSVSSASNEPYRQTCYTSVEIQSGDSLWSIATEYYTEDWEDVESYIDAIKEFNGLTNNVIQAGNYLSIPYITEVTSK